MKRQPFLLTVWSFNRTLPTLLGALLLMNLLLLFFLQVITPKLEQAEAALSEVQQQSRRKELVSPRQAFVQAQQDYQRFSLLLPSNRVFSELIGELYTLAGKCNLEIGQISYTPKLLPDSGVLSYALKFSITGTYDELKRFVYGLEESQRVVVIEQMLLNAAKNREGEELVTLDMNLTTFFNAEGGQ